MRPFEDSGKNEGTTPAHCRARIRWRLARSGWNEADCGRIVFSDESRFQLCPDDYRRLPWPYFSARYCQIIHTARAAIDCLTASQILLGPARSPNLSLIEHVWDTMGRSRFHLHDDPLDDADFNFDASFCRGNDAREICRGSKTSCGLMWKFGGGGSDSPRYLIVVQNSENPLPCSSVVIRIFGDRGEERNKEIDRESETEKEIQRKRDRDTERERQRYREKEIDRDTERKRETERKRVGATEREGTESVRDG
ncbi:transposable element Tc1 transposase [Trichonephila clavipes]|nr:transposable element Tc1 transposase [Trichonephila clavipes]